MPTGWRQNKVYVQQKGIYKTEPRTSSNVCDPSVLFLWLPIGNHDKHHRRDANLGKICMRKQRNMEISDLDNVELGIIPAVCKNRNHFFITGGCHPRDVFMIRCTRCGTNSANRHGVPLACYEDKYISTTPDQQEVRPTPETTSHFSRGQSRDASRSKILSTVHDPRV